MLILRTRIELTYLADISSKSAKKVIIIAKVLLLIKITWVGF